MISVDQGRCVQGRTGETIATDKLNRNRSNDRGRRNCSGEAAAAKIGAAMTVSCYEQV